MATMAVDIIRRRLRTYADQGVFQGLSETTGRLGKTTFNFRWLLGSEFALVLDPKKHEIVVKDVLPSIDHRSFIDRDLRRFIAGRTDTKLPAHRRLDADCVTLSYTNRKQSVSLVMRADEAQYDYAIKSLLTTLNDLFAYLNLYHIDYLHRNFAVPEE